MAFAHRMCILCHAYRRQTTLANILRLKIVSDDHFVLRPEGKTLGSVTVGTVGRGSGIRLLDIRHDDIALTTEESYAPVFVKRIPKVSVYPNQPVRICCCRLS